MALIVEDGTGRDDANSYVTRQEIIDFAAARGVVVADTDATDVLAVKAVDFIEIYREQFIGTEIKPGVQALAFPRAGVSVGSIAYPTNEVPRKIKQAQMQLCVEQANGVVLVPTNTSAASGQFVTKKQLGPIVTEYSEAVALAAMQAPSAPELPQVDALLEPFLKASNVTTAYRK